MLAKGTAGTGMEEICMRTLVMTSAISDVGWLKSAS